MPIALDPPEPEDPAAPAGAGREGCALWADGAFRLRVGDAGPGRVVEIARPFALLGRGAACGVRVEGASASRTHCVLVRTRAAAFVVDLVGRGTWLNVRPVRGAAALADGDALMIGAAEFEVRVEPAAFPRPSRARP